MLLVVNSSMVRTRAETSMVNRGEAFSKTAIYWVKQLLRARCLFITAAYKLWRVNSETKSGNKAE